MQHTMQYHAIQSHAVPFSLAISMPNGYFLYSQSNVTSLVCWCLFAFFSFAYSLVAVRRSALLLLLLFLTSFTIESYTSLYYNYTFYGSIYFYILYYTIRTFACPLFCLFEIVFMLVSSLLSIVRESFTLTR